MSLEVYKYQVYCGPTLVQAYATRLRSHGLNVYLEGTEHVYVESRLTHAGFVCLVQSQFSGVKERDVKQLY